MNYRPVRGAGLALALSLAAFCLASVGAGLQHLAPLSWQQPRAAGILTLQILANGELRLLGVPVEQPQLLALLASRANRRRWRALRLAPAPAVSWAEVLQLTRQLQPGGLPLELQLPPT
jgi:hypothetical protein